MAKLSLRNVTKIYETRPDKKDKKAGKEKRSFKAVDGFSMDIGDNEFIVFVGPSGCGKSTTLRMIAGLEEISSGEIYIGDRLVNDVPPKDRDIAMVFQNYALYPHLSVYDNIAIGLKLRKIPVEKLDENGEKVTAIDKKKLRYLLRKKKRILALKTKVTEPDDIALIESEAEKVEKEIEYYSTTPVQVYRYVHMPKEEIKTKVLEAAHMLDIEGQLKKKPKEMSGGQRQRVALGRAMVRNPKVFLLDEPLSNLDAKLRAAMRVEISALHRRLGTTFIYVTHDQVEAMTMGTRIVVLKAGVIQQIDSPNDLFDYPANKFVAGFIGTPQMNFFEGSLQKTGDKLELTLEGGYKQAESVSSFGNVDEAYLDGEVHAVTVGVRGEDLLVGEEGMPLKVAIVEALGSESYIYTDSSMEESDKLVNDGKKTIVKIQGRSECAAGDVIKVTFRRGKIHVFDRETEKSIILRETALTQTE